MKWIPKTLSLRGCEVAEPEGKRPRHGLEDSMGLKGK
jgi:hypothetical protein